MPLVASVSLWAIGKQGDDGVDDGIDAVDLSQMRLQHFDCGKLTGPEAMRQISRGHEIQFVSHAVTLLLLNGPTRIMRQGIVASPITLSLNSGALAIAHGLPAS